MFVFQGHTDGTIVQKMLGLLQQLLHVVLLSCCAAAHYFLKLAHLGLKSFVLWDITHMSIEAAMAIVEAASHSNTNGGQRHFVFYFYF